MARGERPGGARAVEGTHPAARRRLQFRWSRGGSGRRVQATVRTGGGAAGADRDVLQPLGSPPPLVTSTGSCGRALARPAVPVSAVSNVPSALSALATIWPTRPPAATVGRKSA